MNKNRLENIINLGIEDRYSYSIREIVKLEKVWGVSTPTSWLTFIDEKGNEIFPIWPHKEVAEICIFNEMKVDGHYIESIEYEKFKEFCIPDMMNENISFGVFYDDKRIGSSIDGESLLLDLQSEEEGEF